MRAAPVAPSTLLLPIAVAALLALAARGDLPAQSAPDPFALDLTIPAPAPSVREPLPLEFRLERAADSARAGVPLPEVRARLGGERMRLRDDGLVHVEVHGPTAESPALPDEVFRRFGGERVRAWRNVADGWVPVAELSNLARALPAGSELLAAADRAIPSATEGNGPGLVNTAAYRDIGYDGSGIAIAVIDLGFKGLESSIASGDAPAGTVKVNFTANDDFYLNSDDDHGRFCVEVVHDHAPGAELHAIKIDSSAALGQAVDYCIDEGIAIISMSLVFGLTAWDDDAGAACAAANEAATAGILFFTSAGNDGDKHWEGTSVDGDNDDWVDIDPGDETLELLVEPGKTVEFEVKWDKSGNTNFDIYMFPEDDAGNWLDTGENNGELYEKVAWKNNGDDNVLVRLSIHNVTGANVPIEVYGRGGTWQADLVPWGSTQSPSNSSHPSVLSVGAVPSSAYDSPPLAGGIAAAYSSRGLSNDGMMLPDLCAPTNVSGSFFGNFNGTSAAAPMAAGTAAVLWSANPAATTPQTRTLLFIWSMLKDWGTPGQDPVYGTGGIHFPEYADCDMNGLADVFDVAAGAPDANDNWIPDGCEVTGYSLKVFAPSPEPDDDGIHTVLAGYTTPPPGGLPPPATGITVGIAHDPAVFAGVDVQPGPALAALNGGTGPALFLVQSFSNGFTLQVDFGLDPTGAPIEIPVLERLDLAILRYLPQPGIGGGTAPTALTLTDSLGATAPVPCAVMTTAGPVTPALVHATGILFAEPVRFGFSLGDETVEYDPADGIAQATVLASIDEEPGAPAAGIAVAGFSMAISDDAAALVPVAVEPAPILAALAGGTGPAFFSPAIGAGGVQVDVVYGSGATLLHGDGLAVVRIDYESAPGALAGDLDGETAHLVFANVGTGTNSVTRAGGTSGAIEIPRLADGWVALVPVVAGPDFSRGDCNADGVFDIADPIATLGGLFPPPGSAPTPPECADACDANDDGQLDIADAVRMLGGLFGLPSTPPAAPFPACGADPTADALDCAAGTGCP